MSKVTMPEPVAWVRRHPDGALTAEFLEDAVISPVRKESGAWLPMVTTTQAEAYADARVRETLEQAVQRIDALSDKCCFTGWEYARAAKAVRALIPPLPGSEAQA